jgi:23S rRNA pseudouridine2605 synthase
MDQPDSTTDRTMRLARYLAHSGVASRRAAEGLIRAGRVQVDGEVVTDPATAVGKGQEVKFDGGAISPEEREVWVLNKPRDVVSTASEPGSRRPVTDLIDSPRRLYPVGRLDADSTGLILLTNDGDLANLLTHPRYEVPKTYRVVLRRPVTDDDVSRLAGGVELEDGPTAPAQVERTSEFELLITIHEGRNRQVRRMAEAVGNQVDSLRRLRFGPLELGDLDLGESRKLTTREIDSLWEYAREMEKRS